MMAALDELVRRFGGRCSLANVAPDVVDVELDSRRAGKGCLFAALPGQRFDGAEFAEQALLRGAVAVLSPHRIEALRGDAHRGAINWVHPDARRIAGEVASVVHGSPSTSMPTIAITGTNGKTTVAWFATQLLERCGHKPGLLGTIEYRLAGAPPLAATHTTPEATTVHRLLARHRDGGGDFAVLEASSHALEQERLAGVEVDVAVYTNLSRDHLDYHRDMEQYAAAKARLFDGLSPSGVAVVNADDAWAPRMIEAARARGARIVTYGIGSRADLSASQIRVDPKGIHLFLHGMGISKSGLFLPVQGRHNVENALAALAAVLVSGASPSAALEGLATVSSAPGRLEVVPTPNRDFNVVVDYAHTDAALERVLHVLREVLDAQDHPGRLIVVFGCGGMRDKGKRPAMGRTANELADIVVLTSDNPRDEDPDAILEDIVEGTHPRKAEVHVVPERRAAFELVSEIARPVDMVLIAGKGHERVQKLAGGIEVPFDDRAVAREVFA